MTAPKPLPRPDRDTAQYWAAAGAGTLQFQCCRDCRRFQHFPAPVCGGCLSSDLEWQTVSGRGTVYSYTVVHHAVTPGFEADVPYVVAWVELAEQPGLRTIATIAGCRPDEVHIGLAVRVFFEDREGTAIPQFRPVDGDG